MNNTIEKLLKDIKLELLNLELGYVDQKELRVVYATVEERLENVLELLQKVVGN